MRGDNFTRDGDSCAFISLSFLPSRKITVHSIQFYAEVFYNKLD